MTLKAYIVEEIEKLPERELRSVVDFIGYLQTRDTPKPGPKIDFYRYTARNPLLKLLGAVDIEPVSNSIDRELYG